MKNFILIILFLLAWPARAEAPLSPPLPAALETLKGEGAQMKYLGRDLGFDGWLAVKDGQEQYFYVTPDGGAFVLGVLFNKNGRAITFDQMRRLQGQKDPVLENLADAPSQKAVLAPPAGLKPQATTAAPLAQAPKASKGEQFFAAVQGATSFSLGAASAPEIYVFIDPMCPHCKDLLMLLDPGIAKGQVLVHVIPVGAIHPDSPGLAAALLQEAQPAAALARHMTGATPALVPKDPDPRVTANLKILTDWGFDATPVTVYRHPNGDVKILRGLPQDLNVVLNDLR